MSVATVGAALEIEGYASLWGVADLNGDVVARGAFTASLARSGAGGVRMLHQHEGRAVVGVWDEVEEDERGLRVRGRIHDWSPEARFAQALARAGALDGLSIGFRSSRARREGRLRVLVEVELWEVSLVTFIGYYTTALTWPQPHTATRAFPRPPRRRVTRSVVKPRRRKPMPPNSGSHWTPAFVMQACQLIGVTTVKLVLFLAS